MDLAHPTDGGPYVLLTDEGVLREAPDTPVTSFSSSATRDLITVVE